MNGFVGRGIVDLVEFAISIVPFVRGVILFWTFVYVMSFFLTRC